jgi:hypothetical protein
VNFNAETPRPKTRELQKVFNHESRGTGTNGHEYFESLPNASRPSPGSAYIYAKPSKLIQATSSHRFPPTRSVLDCSRPAPPLIGARALCRFSPEHQEGSPFVFHPVQLATAPKSARGLAHSKTWRTHQHPSTTRSVLDCGSPLPPFTRSRQDQRQPFARRNPAPPIFPCRNPSVLELCHSLQGPQPASYENFATFLLTISSDFVEIPSIPINNVGSSRRKCHAVRARRLPV